MKTLIDILLTDKLISESEIISYHKIASKQAVSICQYFIKNKMLTDEQVVNCVIKNLKFHFFDLINFDSSILATIPIQIEILKKHEAVPIKLENNILYLGMADPTQIDSQEIIKFYTGYHTHAYVVSYSQLQQLFNKLFPSQPIDQKLQALLLQNISSEEDWNQVQEPVVDYDEPIIKMVDNLINHAIEKSATDIHLESFEEYCRIRFRQNGLLHEILNIPLKLAARLITRFKVIANLDISERRLPQDGRIQIHNMDIRVNTCPTMFGEKMVLRLLNKHNNMLKLDELGLSEAQKQIYIKHLLKPQGLILVTGPTGSGKTITLYSALQFINTPSINISTIEDPIEIKLPGINQINTNPKINLHFSTILRALLRQDPDVVMIGEIRDLETAELALNAAQTGHLVLSTVHTNSAIETIFRLISMNIKNYQLISALSLIIAQRLIRKLCPHCKQETHIQNQHYSKWLFKKKLFYKPVGCDECIQGYKGRVAIYEILPMTDDLLQLILANASKSTLLENAKKNGFSTLQENGLEKVDEGITTLCELNRVLY